LKSYFSISIFRRDKSIFGGISIFIFLFKKSQICFKFSTGIIFIHSIIEASLKLSYGIKIFLYPFSLAQITLGKIEFTGLNFQSKESSQINIELFKNSLSSISQVLFNIQIAIHKSYETPDFFISAGAKLTVILVVGNLKDEDFNAHLSLSLLSCTH
jgi:hypothetical protein